MNDKDPETEVARRALTNIDAEIAKALGIIAEQQAKIDRLSKKKGAWNVILEDENGAAAEAAFVDSFQRTTERITLKSAVISAIKEFRDLEFSVPDIHVLLIKRGTMPTVEQPRARISMEMNRLREAGMAEKTFAPETGTAPHRYRLTKKFWKELGK